MIAHILLLPHPEHRKRLLAPGAPIAACIGGVWHFGWTVACDGDRLGAHWLDLGTEPVVPDDALLVLARDGAVVPEGVDRLERVVSDVLGGEVIDDLPLGLDGDVAVVAGAIDGFDVERARARLRDLVAPFGTIVLLDADGREVAP